MVEVRRAKRQNVGLRSDNAQGYCRFRPDYLVQDAAQLGEIHVLPGRPVARFSRLGNSIDRMHAAQKITSGCRPPVRM